MKLWKILKSASSNLARNKGRTILTVVAIFIGSFTISLSLGLNSGVNDYIDRQLGSIGGENILLVTPHTEQQDSGPQKYDPNSEVTSGQAQMAQQISGAGGGFSTEDIDEVTAIDGVAKVSKPKYLNLTYGQIGDSEKYVMSAMGSVDGIKQDILVGNNVDANESNRSELLLPLEFVEVFGVGTAEDPSGAVGKTIKLVAENPLTKAQKTFEAEIVGVANKSIMSTGTGSTAFVSNYLADEVLAFQNENLPESIVNQTQMFYAIADDGQAESVRDAINALDSGKKYDAMTINDMIGMVKSVIDAITYVLVAFAAIALLAASFGIVNTLYMSVSERTREIGLMKAMGLSSVKVFTMFSFEAIMLGFWGSVVAISAAFGVGQVINTVAAQSFLKDLTGFTLIQFPIANILLVMGIIILIAFLAGALPARGASKLNPIDALRYE